MKTIHGYHFVDKTLRDRSPIPPDGKWLPVIDKIELCERGYHGSEHPFDALKYAPGSTLCWCEYRGDIQRTNDKFVASQRRIIWREGISDLLRYFARQQALRVVSLWAAPDIVLDWLMTGNMAIRNAAYSAAYSAACSAAYSTARNAAYSAAYSAACSAAFTPARNAAYSAACSAAYSAACSAARDDFRLLIEEAT